MYSEVVLAQVGEDIASCSLAEVDRRFKGGTHL
jgi:hypothetical protein